MTRSQFQFEKSCESTLRGGIVGTPSLQVAPMQGSDGLRNLRIFNERKSLLSLPDSSPESSKSDNSKSTTFSPSPSKLLALTDAPRPTDARATSQPEKKDDAPSNESVRL